MENNFGASALTLWYINECSKYKRMLLESGEFGEQITSFNRVCYVLKNEDTGKYKIGYTADLKRRIQHLQGSSGCKITEVMVLEPEIDYDESCEHIERMLKMYYKGKQHKGEWFSFGIRDLINIRHLFLYHIEGWDYKENIH